MLKKIFLYMIAVMVVAGFSNVYAEDLEKKMAVSKLIEMKCSQCHTADQAKNKHASKKGFLDIINRMQKKKGANISKEEAKQIADFLGTPSRFLLEEKCTKCHTIDRIIKAHQKGTLNKQTVEKMRKKGAEITDKEAESIWDVLEGYYFVSPQMAP